jgi:multisubunit Na+/H+ antiporter MnhE subunit
MGLWVALDDSLSGAELLAGVAAAAIGALVAEAACHQAALRFRLPAASAWPALRLPWRVAAETVTVYRALWRRLVHGESPRSGLVEVPVSPGAAGEDGVLRRTLLIGEQSLAPNSLALGIDADRGVMVMHRLVKGDQ